MLSTKGSRLPSPTSDMEQGKRNLDEFGYTIHADLLTSEEVRNVRARLAEQAELELEHDLGMFGLRGFSDNAYRTLPKSRFTDQPSSGPPYQQIGFLANKGREFIKLLTIPVLHEYVRHALTGLPYALATMTGLIVRKGAEPQIIHIDQQPLPFRTPMPTGLNIMLCLSDFDEDMGATRVVPGSHRGPAPTIVVAPETGVASIVEKVETVAAVAPAGAAILFESRLWHGQGQATSEKVRYSVVTNYVMHFLKPQDNYPASLHDHVYEGLSKEEKRILGFEAAYSYGGRIAPRFPGDARTNTNCTHPYVPELRR